MSDTAPILRALHLGDLHFWRIPLNPFIYFNKRLLGVGNLIVGGRAKKFRQEMAPHLSARVVELGADALLFSGDFTSTSAPAEFEAARRIFEPVAAAVPLGAYSVPGNHDCYIGAVGDAQNFCGRLGNVFRPAQDIELATLPGGIALLQINATTRNGMGSHGRITPQHMDALAKLREKIAASTMLWVLCHFPAEDPPGVLKHDRGPQLRDCEPLLAFLRGLPVKVLWLHGHHHYRWIYGSPSVPNLAYLNGGAPFLRHGLAAPDLGFHELSYGNSGLLIECHRIKPGGSEWETRAVNWPGAGEYTNLQKWD